MFEQSLVTSAVSGGRGLSRKGSIVAFSVGVQGALLMAFLVGPLIWPATLPKSMLTPKMTSVSLSKPVVKVQPKQQAVQASTSSTAMPRQAVMVEAAHGGMLRPLTTTAIDDGPAVMMDSSGKMGSASLVGIALHDGFGAPVRAVVAAPAKAAPAPVVSSGVMAGRLLAPIQPVYPRIAVVARVEGTVVVTATIDKDGRIVGLQVVSGPPMLRGSAVDAVKEARYRPFLLNGEPTEVITTVTVNFRMGA